MTFANGEIGDPAGLPFGTRKQTPLMLEKMLEARVSRLIEKAIERAFSGDRTALRLCMDRLMPRGRDRPLEFPLPRIGCGKDALQAAADIVQAVGSAELTPGEGMSLIRVVTKTARILKAAEDATTAANLMNSEASQGEHENDVRNNEENTSEQGARHGK